MRQCYTLAQVTTHSRQWMACLS